MKKHVWSFDSESNVFANKFHTDGALPWHKHYCPVVWGFMREDGLYKEFWWNHNDLGPNDTNHEKNITEINEILDSASTLIIHNAQYDLVQLLGFGFNIFKPFKLWDTMVVHYRLNGQRALMPSLNEVAQIHGLEPKLDKVKELWNQGLNTDSIPMKLLSEYLKQDCKLPLEIYKRQLKDELYPQMSKVLALHCEFGKELAQASFNGMKVNKEQMLKNIEIYDKKIGLVVPKILDLCKIPKDKQHLIDLANPRHKSVVMFGGTITETYERHYMAERWAIRKVDTGRVYKSGKRKGEAVLKNERYREEVTRTCKNAKRDHYFDGAGFKRNKRNIAYGTKDKDPEHQLFSVDKAALEVLLQDQNLAKFKRAIVVYLQHLQKLVKTRDTFESRKNPETAGYLSKLTDDNYLHTNYNQAKTATGRLSSSDPNLQNIGELEKKPFISRYGTDGQMVGSDASQLEWRGAIHYYRDEVGAKEIINGLNYHDDNKEKFFEPSTPKKIVKAFGFSLPYGATNWRFALDPLFPNNCPKYWQEKVDMFFSKYKGMADGHKRDIDFVNTHTVTQKVWNEKTQQVDYRDYGYLNVETGTQFRFKKEPLKKYQGALGYKESRIKNYPGQGINTGEYMALAYIVICRRLRAAQEEGRLLSVKPVGPVHDSIIADVRNEDVREWVGLTLQVFDEWTDLIKQYFGVEFIVPLKGEAEIGPTYADKEWEVTRNVETGELNFTKLTDKPKEKTPAWTPIYDVNLTRVNIYTEEQLEKLLSNG